MSEEGGREDGNGGGDGERRERWRSENRGKRRVKAST